LPDTNATHNSMPKITNQQVSAVRTYMHKQVDAFVRELNNKVYTKQLKKYKPEIDKINKEFAKVSATIKKFNDKNRKRNEDFYPVFGTGTRNVEWKGKGNQYISAPSQYSTQPGVSLSRTYQAKKQELNDQVELFLLKLQLQEAAHSDIEKFLKKILK